MSDGPIKRIPDEVDQDVRLTVSVIVVNCNGGAETANCVRSLVASNPAPSEIIVVDNGSTDGSAALIQGLRITEIPVGVIELATNRGPAEARNIGAERAIGDVLAFLDNDTTAQSDWLGEALRIMSSLRADCIQCKLVLASDRTRLDSLGYLIGPFGFPRHLVRTGARDRLDFDQPRRLFGVKSAGMVISRRAFVQAGAFDPAFFMYGEETDLCWRVIRNGGSVVLAPRSIVFHNAGGTGRLLPGKAAELLYRGGPRNYIRMVAKNTVPRRIVIDLSGQVVIWSAVAILQALRGRFAVARLILLGVADGLRELPQLIRGRRQTSLPFIDVPRNLRMGIGLGYIWKTLRAA
ncbi:MAG: hypothetical protein QOH92_1661 [Chloroflexota bacterium]|jgi:GT2 family glycosyltransferase|nr:hypothetical protein [Chloroflexota bacterium]